LSPANVPTVQYAPAPLPLLRTGQPWPVAWSNVWVPLETWTRLNGLGQPTLAPAGTEPAFSVGYPEGMIRLKVGSQTAHAGGHDCLLGFPPRLVGGIAYLHSLDLQKTLQPLLSGGWEIPAPTNRVIVLDPGHGGRDSGTLNGFGTENEKYFTLDWARRLEPLLTGAGWKVILTRTNDVDVPLLDRVQIADAARADLFLSLHFNAGGPNATMNGLETFCLTPTGLPSSLRRDFVDDPREILPNNTHDRENLLLASRLHRAMLKISGATDRGVRRARFMTVLRLQNRPAVLIEGGYLSNPQEARRIATASYRQLLAEALAQVLNTPDLAISAETASTAGNSNSIAAKAIITPAPPTTTPAPTEATSP
jgi:N-acetylmuramoyl-L-alanine amidase